MLRYMNKPDSFEIMKSIQGNNKAFKDLCLLNRQPTREDYRIFRSGIDYCLQYLEKQEKEIEYDDFD